MQSETIVLFLVKTFIGSFSLTFSVTKQEKSKYKSQIHWISNQNTHTHKREREREIWKRGKGGEAQIGLSNQTSKKGHHHGCNKNRLPRCDKNSQRDHLGCPHQVKQTLFSYTQNFHTLNINKAIVTASFIILSRERERERERRYIQKISYCLFHFQKYVPLI